MEKQKSSLLLLLLFMTSTICWAQTDTLKGTSDCINPQKELNHLKIGLNYLTHGEVCSGGLPKTANSTEDHSSFILGRTRMIVDYNRKNLESRAVIQNSAIWGARGNQSLNLYETWVKLNSNFGLFVQIGRIALSYDDERIIGLNDFANASLSHDALRIGYEKYGHKFHAIFAYNQNGDNVYTSTYYDDGAQYYKNMQTCWYHYDIPRIPLGVSLLFMNMGLQAGTQGSTVNPPKTVYQQMVGGYINYHPKYLTFEASYYRQTGKVVNEIKLYRPIEAWMASAKATIKPADSYGFEIGYDYLSGDDYVPVTYGGTVGLPQHSVEGGFYPLYGSRVKFYGIMDYFYESAYINGFTPGLQNAFLGAYLKPTSKVACRATYHYLAVATDLKGLDRTLGHSIDLQASYKFTKDITLMAGYTQMMGTETMDRLKQGNDSKRARWGWFSLIISPTLFSSKW